ncbi:MAG: NAD(P)H-hydrate dehydratase [Chloroflexota bacterium]
MTKYVSVQEMQAIERQADAGGWSYAEMMEAAGNGLAGAIQETYGFLSEDGALGLVGSGNNGGDALVALARLAGEGWRISALVVRPRPASDPLIERLQQAGGQVLRLGETAGLDDLPDLIAGHGLLLDGVLGTGARLPLKPELAETLAAARRALAQAAVPPVVVAVDCPSGIDCDSGAAAPECLPADLTVTMAAVKHGLLKFPAYSLLGELQLVGIGLPDGGEQLAAWRAVQTFIPDEDWVSGVLPARPPDAHKGTFGTLLAVAGSASYTGAAWLAGQAAYRAGAGLVTLAVPAPLHAALAGAFPEATWVLLPHEDGFIAWRAIDKVRQALPHASALLVGPGFGMLPTSLDFLDRLFPRDELHASGEHPPQQPLVLDADGLKLVAQLPDWPSRLPAHSVLTPHPGEMGVLTGLGKDDIQAQRLELARRCSQEWGHIVVLKGAFTVIAAPDGRAAVLPVASAALARAGTGDVLAGLIGGLLAQGTAPFEAAVAAAWVHAAAGLLAAEQYGSSAPVLAGDVLNAAIEVLGGL